MKSFQASGEVLCGWKREIKRFEDGEMLIEIGFFKFREICVNFEL
jgi:hypothetical protein